MAVSDLNKNTQNMFTSEKDLSKHYASILGHEKQFQQLLDKLVEQSDLKRLQKELARAKGNADKQAEIKAKMLETIQNLEQTAANVSGAIWADTYKKATSQQKIEMMQQVAQSKAAAKEAADYELMVFEQIADRGAENYQQMYDEKVATAKSAAKAAAAAETAAERTKYQEAMKLSRSLNKEERAQGQAILKEQAKQTRQKYADSIQAAKAAQQTLDDLRAGGASEEEIAVAQANVDAANADMASAQQANMDAKAASLIAGLKDAITDGLKQLGNAVSAQISKAEGIITSYQSNINASLQGSDKNWQDMMDMVTKNLAISPIVKMEDVITNIKAAADQGIAYNIEQRAFLNTVSDKIAHTFDAFDSNLTRLIRLQQADTTAARLGMEASLTKFLNSRFNDSSYLSNIANTVSGAILEANSQLNKEAATEFEFVVQKWLGALSSLGLSNETVTNIATGINYLATGNVQGLANNNSLQTLMAMSASNAGLDYANLLLEGLDASNTNKLLQSMVEYLKTIAENSDNQVVKAAYGDIFNMSVADMKAISNLTNSEIASIAGTNLSYQTLLNETSNQLLQTVTRSSLAENMNNIFSNAVFGMGMDMASNPGIWAMNKMLQFMDSSGININIPTVMAAGFGLDLETSVNDLMRMGIGLTGAMSLIGNILEGLGTPGGGTGLSLAAWGGTEYNQRGSGLGGLLGTIIGGTTSSTYVNNASSSDMTNEYLNQATDDAAATEKITNKNQKKVDLTMDDLFAAVVGDGATDYIKSQDVVLRYVYNDSLNALTVYDEALRESFSGVFGGANQISTTGIKVYDSMNVSATNRVANSLSNISDSNYIRVRDVGSGISNLISEISKMNSSVQAQTKATVKLDPNTKIQISEQTFVNALLTAFGAVGDGQNAINLKSLVDGLNNGTTKINVTTQAGDKVNTHITGVDSWVNMNVNI